MNSSALTAPAGLFRKAGLRETAVLLALAWFLPFAIHLVPWSGERPLGSHLLPMFWAAFVAVYYFGPFNGLLVGLFAPALNLIVTGLPAWRYVGQDSLELVIFTLVAVAALRRFPRLVLIAPGAYLVARTAWALIQSVANPAVELGEASNLLARSLVNSLAGLIILAAINAALVWFYPKGPLDDGGSHP